MQQLQIKDLFTKTKLEWLEEARSTARKLLQSKVYVTIEDVLAICPRPSYFHHNIVGQVFHDPDFTSIGFTLSRRPISHHRVVRMWRLKRGLELPPPDEPEDEDEPVREWPDIA